MVDLADQYISPFLYVGNNPIVYLDHDGNVGGPGKQSTPNDPIERLKIELNFAQSAINKFVDLYMFVWGVSQSKQAVDVVNTAVKMTIEHGSPDMISLYAYADVAFGVGVYHEVAQNWMLSGPDSRLSPYSTYTGGATAGMGAAGVGFGLRVGWSFQEKPTFKSFLGFGTNLDVGGSIPGRRLLNWGIDTGIAYDDTGIHWATVSGEIGIGISYPGISSYAAETYTIPIYKED